MNLPLRIVTICGATLTLFSAPLRAEILTHGPVVGGVTATEAKVFVRTDTAATVALRYGTDPGLVGAIDTAGFRTADASDFTTTIPLSELVPETT